MTDGTTSYPHDNVIALGDRSAPVEVPWEVWRFAFERASEHWCASLGGRLSGGMPEESWRVLGFGIIQGRDAAALREAWTVLWEPEGANDNEEPPLWGVGIPELLRKTAVSETRTFAALLDAHPI